MMSKVQIEIKGVQNSLMVVLGEGKWQDAENSLIERVNSQSGFFKGAKIVVDVGNRELSAFELGALRDHLADLEVTLGTVISTVERTKENARRFGLATRIPSSQSNLKKITPLSTEFEGEAAVMIHRTMRSGFRIAHPGHVTVIGDVNPGAEIIAGGNIVIWGRLRGLVHAGADGNYDSTVCALDMNPTQLRIADKIAVPPKRKKGEKVRPEIAMIINEQVVAETWNYKK